jgi:hypothetical protein
MSSMSMVTADALALLRFHGFGGRGGGEIVLLLVGVVFAGLIVWAIQSSGKPTIYR